MKVSTLKTGQRVEALNNRSLKIQSYGEGNDYPQRIMEVVAASVTGGACLDNYTKFIIGRGFAQKDFYKRVVNAKGERVDEILKSVARDYAQFHGFALHVNYNGLYEVTSVYHIPFEWLRFQELDEHGRFDRLALHPDWGKRYRRLRPFRAEDIQWFHFFNPDPEVIQKEVDEAGGWNGYNGQIFYYSGEGAKVYPVPIFDSVVTDMSTEEGLSNIDNRNVRHNFLPSGMLIDKDNTANDEEQERAIKEELRQFQGDMQAGKMLYISLRNKDNTPEWVPFQTKNFDKDFETSNSRAPEKIGRAFMQPPILRAESVSTGFDTDAMESAYNFYNSITDTERTVVSEVFAKVFALWHDPSINPDADYTILPKVYDVGKTLAERLGSNVDKVQELVLDKTRTESEKRAVLEVIYGLDEEDIDKLVNTVGQ